MSPAGIGRDMRFQFSLAPARSLAKLCGPRQPRVGDRGRDGLRKREDLKGPTNPGAEFRETYTPTRGIMQTNLLADSLSAAALNRVQTKNYLLCR
jgi:hypothetical protein